MLRVLQAGLALAALGLGAAGFSSSLPVLVLMSIVYIAGISLTIPTMISLVGMLAGDRRGAAVARAVHRSVGRAADRGVSDEDFKRRLGS
ncbi:Uncharacterized protein TXXE_17590 [Thermobacillus xylanilyticus]|uniref:MFS transporter n=1 Tax=Thermobacillus xylanilyticus TaxID=76633 RepID=A0ABN7S9B9_THEXY|nr:Uncharacterized protein TXXE_17590 [Thermobacillus xylanilyticus]